MAKEKIEVNETLIDPEQLFGAADKDPIEQMVEQEEEIPADFESQLDALDAETEKLQQKHKDQRRVEAFRKIRTIALRFQGGSPNEHVVFGHSDIRFTLGDLRDLVGLPRA